MNNFESQLASFGKYRRTETNKQLQYITNPRQKQYSIAWITTPVAAFIGILIGLGIQLNTDFQEKTAKPEQTKTLKEVIALPEFCYVDFATTIELPKFEIIINQTNTEL